LDTIPEPVGNSKVILNREVYIHEYPHQKTREISDNLMIHLKLLHKQDQANPKCNIWKEIIKIMAEIYELETQTKFRE
jgi:hypothetical protein